MTKIASSAYVADLVEQGNLEKFQSTLLSCEGDKKKKDFVNYVDGQKWSFLHRAAISGQPAMIEWLMSDAGGRVFGFDRVLSTTEYNHWNALHLAARNGSFEAFLAVVNGAKVENGERIALLNAVDDAKWTVLHHAAASGHAAIVSWILSDSGGRAAGFNKVLAKGSQGESILRLAVQEGRLEACIAIVNGSSKVENGERDRLLNDVSSKSGWTILHFVTARLHAPIISWLLSEEEGGGRASGFHSDHIFAVTDEQQTALHLAAAGGSVDCFEALISACKSSNDRLRLLLAVDDHGWTIFHTAARSGNSDFIAYLLVNYPEESQMIIDAKDNRGMTVLQRTIIYGIDEKSRDEWMNWRRKEVQVVQALLAVDSEDVAKERAIFLKERSPETQIAILTADPNIGL